MARPHFLTFGALAGERLQERKADLCLTTFNGSVVPRLVNSLSSGCCVCPQRPVFQPRCSAGNTAHAEKSVLRAHAARKPNSQDGLSPVIRCAEHESPVSGNCRHSRTAGRTVMSEQTAHTLLQQSRGCTVRFILAPAEQSLPRRCELPEADLLRPPNNQNPIRPFEALASEASNADRTARCCNLRGFFWRATRPGY